MSEGISGIAAAAAPLMEAVAGGRNGTDVPKGPSCGAPAATLSEGMGKPIRRPEATIHMAAWYSACNDVGAAKDHRQICCEPSAIQ